VIAPGIVGCFGAIIFLTTKYGVLKRKNPVWAAFISVPIHFALTSGILTILIVWKGAASAASAVKSGAVASVSELYLESPSALD
jgi:sodium-dependent phosphate transporter